MGMTEGVEADIAVSQAYEYLRVELRRAMDEEKRCEKHFAAPFSDRQAEIDMHRARGICQGIARCMEVLEAVQEEAR